MSSAIPPAGLPRLASARSALVSRSLGLLGLSLVTLVFAARGQTAAPAALPSGVTYVTSVEGINEYRLTNGLRVLLFADPTKSNITVNITYLVGSRHEDYGETGMAHLLEHLLFKGSTNHPNIPKELQDHGTRPNGTTWVDRTNYFETFAATDENLKWALELEADRMVNSFVARKDLDSEMTVVRNEFEYGENNPNAVLYQRTLSSAFLWHNYGKSTIGARSDVERVPIDRLQAFYRHFYQPDNAVLVVAGKIDEPATLALVDRTFSPIPKPSRVLRKTYTSEPTQDGERSVTLRRAGDVQAICVVYHVPPGTHEEFAAVQLASAILGSTPSGRLHKALVETGLAVGAGGGAQQLMEPGVVIMSASVRTEKSLDEATSVMLATIDDVKTKPFTDEEVNRAKTQWLKNVDLLMNDSQRLALQLSEWQAMGDWRMLFLHRDRVRAVTRDQIQKAADTYFIPSNRTVGKFFPDKSPVRAEIPEPPDVALLLKDYRGDASVAKGEEFDASAANIDRLTQRVDLPGGLKLSLLPKKTRGARVTARIDLRFGDENSLRQLSPSAAMAGQLLMRGTTRHTRQQIRDAFDRLKADVSIGGGVTGVSASIQTTRENLAAVLDLVAEILKEPAFPESEFTQLKQQFLAGYENQKSDPQSLASNALSRHLRPAPKGDVRYVPTLDERVEETTAVTLEQTKQFHREFYGASHGEVVFIGDFDPDAVQKQVAALLGGWKSPKPHARITRMFTPVERLVKSIEAPDKANANWMAALPLQMNDTHADYPALVLSNYILGSGMNSRLFQRVRGKEGLSYGVGSQFSAPIRDDDARFMASAICAPQNAPKVEAAFKDELATILSQGFTDAEVDAAKKSWLQSRSVSRAQDGELAGRLQSHRYWNRTMAHDTELEQKVAALTPAAMQAAMKKHLDVAKMTIVRAGDFKKANVDWSALPAPSTQ
jgi:zinc protease